MDFCYVWLRRLVGSQAEGFDQASTRATEELTGNVTRARGLEHFTEGLARVYRRMARALGPGAPLAFTYHHNKAEAYHAIGVAILDAGLTCSAALPCPAEMSGSIQIHGTASSIIDTVFVCRDRGWAPKRWLFRDANELTNIVSTDLQAIAESGHKPTRGDIYCITLGHLTRMAIWNLRGGWNAELPTQEKLSIYGAAMNMMADADAIAARLGDGVPPAASHGPLFAAADRMEKASNDIAF